MLIDPCGMVMGYIRTAYRTRMRLFPGDPTTYPVRWYRAPKKAKLFPGQHFGLSRDWFNYRPDFGEVGKRHYDKGENIRHTKGQCYRGQLEWFQNGIDLASLVGQTVSPDHCTSCPGVGPNVEIGVALQLDYKDWLSADDNFHPVCCIMTVSGDTGGRDGQYEFVWAGTPLEDRWQHQFSPPGPNNLLFLTVRAGVWALFNIFGPPDDIGGPQPVTSDNPLSLTAVATGLGSGTFSAGAVLTVNAVLVVPHYYEHATAAVVFAPRNNRSLTSLALGPLGGIFIPPGGPSPFDSGFDVGFGG